MTEPTVIRFASGLGLDGYPALVRLCRQYLREQAQLVRRYDSLEQRGDLVENGVALDHTNITRTFARIDRESLAATIGLLAESSRVHVLGLRKCHAPAYLLAYLLRMLRDDVELITATAGSLTDELRRVREDDCFVAISIHRYSAATVLGARWARECGAKVVALTDNASSPLVGSADHTFYVEAASPSVLRSMTAFTTLVQTLAAGVAQAAGRNAREHLLVEEQLLAEFGVYTAGPDKPRAPG